MNQKGFVPILIILGVIVIVVFFGWKYFLGIPSNKIKEVPSLTYEKEGKIYFLSGLNSQPLEVGSGSNPMYSFKASKIAYLKVNKDETDTEVVVYDISSKNSDTLTNGQLVRQLSWSPGGKYLIVDSGSAVVGSSRVYELQTKKVTTSFPTSSFVWVTDDILLISKLQRFPNSSRQAYESSDLFGSIYRINLPSGQEKALFLATEKEDYRVYDMNNGTVRISQTSVKSEKDWMDWPDETKIKKAYLQIDSNGKDQGVLAVAPISQEKKAKDLLSQTVNSQLP